MKRKIIILALICFVSTLLLSSCSGFVKKYSRFFQDDRSDANAKMDKVLEALKNKDKEALKALFSSKAIAQTENIDKSIDELIEYFKGNFVSYNDWGGPMVEGGINDDGTDRNWKCIYSSYDVETSGEKYRLYIQDFTVDTADEDNVEIHSLYIIKMKDDTDPQFGYWGDGKDTPGINIGIKNVLPKEDPSISAVTIEE